MSRLPRVLSGPYRPGPFSFSFGASSSALAAFSPRHFLRPFSSLPRGFVSRSAAVAGPHTGVGWPASISAAVRRGERQLGAARDGGPPPLQRVEVKGRVQAGRASPVAGTAASFGVAFSRGIASLSKLRRAPKISPAEISKLLEERVKGWNAMVSRGGRGKPISDALLTLLLVCGK
eukprot:GHVT01061352.1.p1 GENE.GHVT01061352.1~~GHVT01061352.1.p1  ORF type:complete len:198 (-),score=37.39 GHVT01061352.1:586-1113(-)